MIECETETPGAYAVTLRVGAHSLRSDLSVLEGGAELGPSPHDFFDAALASCKSLTAEWYAKRHGFPLERVETQVTRDDSGERTGTYVLRVKVAFHGPLSQEQRDKLFTAVSRCPVHKLMTAVEVRIETEPLGA